MPGRGESSRFPLALMIAGALLGATTGWWLGLFFGTFLAGQIAICVGAAIEPTKKRATLALLLTLVMWWPFWLGHLLWD